MLRPTIRKDGSELWFSWNPTRKTDPVDALFRGGSPPTGSVIVRANWRDNPWFPSVLEQERADDMRDRPDQYEHVWEGDYVKVTEGAYYAQGLTLAKNEGRISEVAADPLATYRAIWDIGGTGPRRTPARSGLSNGSVGGGSCSIITRLWDSRSPRMSHG